ncbi:MAG TPA: dynamin family protein [Verrucomicrobiae bacterium]|nr:dynamin family protein [Verrucomicrobiae bacterium]
MIETVPDDTKRYLDSLTALADIYGDDLLRADLASIVEQSHSNAASVVVLGQFKRGKSSLINALLGDDVLPTGRLPLTGVMTRIAFGERRATVHYLDGRAEPVKLRDLATFVTEEHNPKNERGVAQVDVTLPIAMLREMTLTDTPGIASTFEHNTQTAREASERVDLGIFVTGPEPPLTNEEVAFLRHIRDLADRVIVVLAKIDLAEEAEAEVVAFTRNTVEAALHEPALLFSVDARRHDARVDTLRDAIGAIVAEGGGSLARRSRSRRIHRVVGRIQRSLELRRAATLLPSEQRAEARDLFARIADDVDERGQILIRAIESFPMEELISIDVLLDDLLEGAATALHADIDRFVDLGPSDGEEAIFERVAAFEADWAEQVSSALAKRIEKRHTSAFKLVAELEERFSQAANEALGLESYEDTEADSGEFGTREAATRMSAPIPTTGLELVTGGLLSALPGPLRSHALRKRYRTRVAELLDRSKGRVRAAATRYLLEWRLANVGLVRERLAAARHTIEDAFDRANASADDPETDSRLQGMERDERMLDAIVAAFP